MKKFTSFKINEVMKLFLVLFMTFNIIIVTIGGVSFVYTLNVFRDSIYQQNVSNIENVRSLLESKVSATEDLAQDIYASISVSDIASKESLIDANSQYTLSKLIDHMSYSSSSNSFVQEAYVYLSKSSTIIGEEGCYDAEFYYNNYIAYEGMTFEEWKRELSEYSVPSYSKQAVTSGVKSYEVIEYIKPFNVFLGDSFGCVIINYDNDEILSVLQKGALLSETSTQIVYIPTDETIISAGDYYINTYIKDEKIPIGESTLEDTDFGNLFVLRNISMNGNFEYIYAIPNGVFYSGADTLVFAMITIMLLQIVLGAILTVLFSKRSYKPIQRMTSAISDMVLDYNDASANPIKDITQITTRAVNEHDAIKKELEHAKPMMIKSFLTQVLHGNISESKFLTEHMAEDMFEKDGFICIKIHIEDCKEFIVEDTIEEMQLAKIAILNMVEEVFSEKFQTTVLDYDFTNVVVILNVDYTQDEQETEAYFKEIAEIFNSFQSVLYDYLKIYTSAGVSLIHKGISKLYIAVKQSQEAINQKIVSGVYEISFYKTYSSTMDAYSYKLQDEVYLINSTKTGDYNKVKELLQEIVKDNENVFASPLMAQCFIIDLVSTMFRIVSELSVPSEIIDIEIADVLSGSYSTILEKIYANYKIICNWVNKNKKSHNTQMREQIETYIKGHYLDNSLSLVSVADYMNLNPTYLSVFIKEQLGDTFVSYVLNLRMQEAKRLLNETTLSMQDIAVKIGYANSGVFIRVFKKKFGYTPGSYRSYDK